MYYKHPTLLFGMPHISCYAFRMLSYYVTQEYKTLLDLGCGVGREISYWIWKGLEVEGADIEEQVLPVPFALVDLDDTRTPLPWDDDSFDVVTLIHTVEHLHNPGYAVSEAVRVAKEIVLINAPFMDSYPSEDHVQAWHTTEELISDLGLDLYACFLEMVVSKPEDVESTRVSHIKSEMEIKFRDIGFISVIYKKENKHAS